MEDVRRTSQRYPTHCLSNFTKDTVLVRQSQRIQSDMKNAISLDLPNSNSSKSADPDNPHWSEEMIGPPVIKPGRGPQKTPTKVLTTVRLDADVIAFFRAQSSGYQTRINDELRKIVTKNLAPRSTRLRAKPVRPA